MLFPPALAEGWKRLAVPRKIPGDHAKALLEFGIGQHVPVLAAVRSGGMLQYQRDRTGAGFLVIDSCLALSRADPGIASDGGVGGPVRLEIVGTARGSARHRLAQDDEQSLERTLIWGDQFMERAFGHRAVHAADAQRLEAARGIAHQRPFPEGSRRADSNCGTARGVGDGHWHAVFDHQVEHFVIEVDANVRGQFAQLMQQLAIGLAGSQQGGAVDHFF
jgi:hypothetical protein